MWRVILAMMRLMRSESKPARVYDQYVSEVSCAEQVQTVCANRAGESEQIGEQPRDGTFLCALSELRPTAAMLPTESVD